MTRKMFHPVDRDSRICFGISFFLSEKEADEYAKFVKEQGYTYNGGYFDGMPCGRDKSFDRVVGEQKQYAVTD